MVARTQAGGGWYTGGVGGEMMILVKDREGYPTAEASGRDTSKIWDDGEKSRLFDRLSEITSIFNYKEASKLEYTCRF